MAGAIANELWVPAWARNPRGQVLPGGAAPGGPFDFYISPTGSNANTGTSIGSPWAITAINAKQSTYAGKRLGILPGTYDVSGLMGSFHSPALMINGGLTALAPTYIGTANSSGLYAQGTATLDAKGASGFFGGSNTTISTVMGQAQGQSGGPGTPANWGNWTVDGLIFIGFSAWAFQVGSYDGGGGQVPNTAIQNCTFANGNGGNNVSVINNGLHSGPLELYQYNNCLVSNCWFHDNSTAAGAVDFQHFSAITVWGGITPGVSTSTGLTLQFNTIVNSGCIYGIPDTGVIGGTTLTGNYIDSTNAASGTANPCTVALLGFANSAAASKGLAGSIFSNNIFRGGVPFDSFASEPGSSWSTTCKYFNNTWDLAGGAGFPSAGGIVGHRFFEPSGVSAVLSFYNNLMYDNGYAGTLSPYGYVVGNVDEFAVSDYNIWGTRNHWTTFSAGSTSAGQTTRSTLATWGSAIGGETHSSTNATNPFTNVGIYAGQYTTPSGPAFGTGRIGGVSGGAACNVGAWDGTIIKIGCSFAT